MEEDTRIKDIREGYTKDRTIRALFHSWTRGPSVANRTLSIYRITQMAVKDTDTLFYKLFGMSKRQWDAHIKLHQKQLNKKQRDYFLTVRPEKEKK